MVDDVGGGGFVIGSGDVNVVVGVVVAVVGSWLAVASWLALLRMGGSWWQC